MMRISVEATICARLRQPGPAVDGVGRLRSKRSRVHAPVHGHPAPGATAETPRPAVIYDEGAWI